MLKSEYRVRAVKRYVVTRWHTTTDETGRETSGSCETKGEFDSYETAYHVGYALAKDESDRRGLFPGDMGVIFPAYEGVVPMEQLLPPKGAFDVVGKAEESRRAQEFEVKYWKGTVTEPAPVQKQPEA